MKHRVERIERRDVELDARGQVVWLGAHADRVAHVEQHATLLVDRFGLADDDDRNVGRSLFLQVDHQQVDVQRKARDRVHLDVLQQHRLCGTVALDYQVEHDVAAGVPVKHLELARVDFDRLRIVAGAVHNGG